MKWKKYTVYTTTEAEDMVSMLLIELGAEGVQIEDNVPLSESDTKGMFIDILPELPPDDGSSRVSFFLHLAEPAYKASSSSFLQSAAANNSCANSSHKAPDPSAADLSYTIADRLWKEDEIAELLNSIRSGLDNLRSFMDIGEGRIEEGATEETDWRDSWKQFFRPFTAGAFLIRPEWEEIPDEHRPSLASGALKLITINPGTAFGTGSHETTRLCLDAIEGYVSSGDIVLDIGTGSGILGIAALKSGALFAAATELDPQCAESVRDNTRLNNIGIDEFRLFIGNIIDDEDIRRNVRNAIPDACTASGHSYCETASEQPSGGNVPYGGYDTAIANILAPVICTLAGSGQTDTFLKKGGIFITSGILDERLPDVLEAFGSNPSWLILEVRTMGEWRSVIAQRI